MFDFYLHDMYFVVAPRHVALGLGLLWAVSAVVYFFSDQFLAHRLSNSLTLAHFLLWNFSFIALFLGSWSFARAIQSHHDPAQSWLLISAFVAPVVGFIVGGILFLSNLAWAILLKFKTT